MLGQAHQCVAVSGHEADFIFQQLLAQEARVLRIHRGAATEHASDARLVQTAALVLVTLGDAFEQLRRCEQRAHAPVFHNRRGLVDDVFHVRLGLVILLFADEPLHPARVEVHKITRASAHIGKMLDGQPQPPRPRGADHQPVMITRKRGVIQRVGKLAVIHLVIIPADALLGHPRGAAGFENIERLP